MCVVPLRMRVWWRIGHTSECRFVSLGTVVRTSAARSKPVGGEPTEGDRCEEEGEAACTFTDVVILVV